MAGKIKILEEDMANLDVLKKTVEEAEQLLKNKEEWIDRYGDYAKEITSNEKIINLVRKSFRESPPLYVYSSISRETNATKEDRVTFDLRYKGQSVATIKYKNKIAMLETKENTNEYFSIEGGKTFEWDSKGAELFRKHFKNFPCRNKKGRNNEEHRFESALITELSKSIGKNKKVKHIQPVRLLKSRFQMPTPFSARSLSDL